MAGRADELLDFSHDSGERPESAYCRQKEQTDIDHKIGVHQSINASPTWGGHQKFGPVAELVWTYSTCTAAMYPFRLEASVLALQTTCNPFLMSQPLRCEQQRNAVYNFECALEQRNRAH